MSDTKICPYCAETIKAAAIKCRYCGSDLGAETAPAAPVAAEMPPPPPPPPPARAVVGEPEATPTPRPRWFLPALVASAVVLVVFAGLALVAWRDAQDYERAQDAGAAVQAMISDRMKALLTYSYETFDAEQSEAQEALTEGFRERYAPDVEALRERALRDKLTQEAVVVATGILSSSEDEVEALLFVNTYTTPEGAKQARLVPWEVRVEVVREGGSWLIDDVRFLSS